MKRTQITILLVALLLICQSVMPAFAQDATTVYVTISDGEGKLVLSHAAVSVTDVDEDNQLTIHDTLYCAHEQYYPGGAQAGYLAETSAWGLSLMKLWGVENGGSYGYYLNNASPQGLTDSVGDGDTVKAFVYTDTATFSDTFSYFDQDKITLEEAGEVTLTLQSVSFDYETFTPVVTPIAGAKIFVGGQDTGVVTDAAGQCTIAVSTSCVISAMSDTVTLVPPVCVVEMSSSEVQDETMPTSTPKATPKEENGNGFLYVGIGAGVLVVVIVAVVLVVKTKK